MGCATTPARPSLNLTHLRTYSFCSFSFLFLVAALLLLSHPALLRPASATALSSSSVPYVPVPPFKTRADLGDVLAREGMQVGVELGVQKGKYTDQLLRRWVTVKRYVLVDLWRHQDNYDDLANMGNDIQEAYKQETLTKVEKFKKNGVQIDICQGFTIHCAKKFKPSTFDFIYVDARHDYKGVTQDLQMWWPLLRNGGIMAGHDYVVNKDGPAGSGQNWTINYDGTVDHSGRAVKGAVDDFVTPMGLQLQVSYREGGFNTWAVRKPGPHPYPKDAQPHNLAPPS